MKNKKIWKLESFQPKYLVERIAAGAITATLLVGVIMGASPILKELVYWPVSVAESEVQIEKIDTSGEEIITDLVVDITE